MKRAWLLAVLITSIFGASAYASSSVWVYFNAHAYGAWDISCTNSSGSIEEDGTINSSEGSSQFYFSLSTSGTFTCTGESEKYSSKDFTMEFEVAEEADGDDSVYYFSEYPEVTNSSGTVIAVCEATSGDDEVAQIYIGSSTDNVEVSVKSVKLSWVSTVSYPPEQGQRIANALAERIERAHAVDGYNYYGEYSGSSDTFNILVSKSTASGDVSSCTTYT